MSELIDAVKRTRETAASIMARSLSDCLNNTEAEIRDRIFSETNKHAEIYPSGWYDPPKNGIAVLVDDAPFKRLRFETLRIPEFWPNTANKIVKESVGIAYMSPVDKKTNMIGDIGLTIYSGENDYIKNHIKECYDATLAIAEYARPGMEFKELCVWAKNLLKERSKTEKWIKLFSDPNTESTLNLGHTVPGIFEKSLDFGIIFEDIRETIRARRTYVSEGETFKIPDTCAFTIETRLADIDNENLPNVFFHFIVTFDNGKKEILKNFEEIFRITRMNYING